MRAWELYENQIINELNVEYRGDTVNDESFDIIVHRGKIWMYDSSDDNNNEALKKSIIDNLKINIERPEDLDIEDLMAHVMEDRPDIIHGQIVDGDDLYLSNHATISKSPRSSKAIKDIVKHFDLSRVMKSDTTGEKEDVIHRSEMQGKVPDIAFHGTSSDNIRNILNKGIMPVEHGNFEDIKFPDLVFVATDRNFVDYHATSQAKAKEATPIVLKLKIPDKNKLVLDFDVAVRMYGSEHPELIDAGYDNIDSSVFNNEEMAKHIQAVNKGTDLNTEVGVFGYKGRIPANHILEIYIAADADWTVAPDSVEWMEMDDKSELWKALDMIDAIGYYDQHEQIEWEDDEDENL